jgi:hypothetical protein
MKHEVPMTNESQSMPATSCSCTQNRIKWFLVIPVLLCVSGAITFFLRAEDSRKLTHTTQTLEAEQVTVIHAQQSAPATDLALPATLQAYSDSPIYARTNGYVSHWYADMCARDNCLP